MVRIPPGNIPTERTLLEFTRRLNRTFYQESMVREGRVEMVTTLAAVVIEGTRLLGVNAGDSCVYLCQGSARRQLSGNHADPGLRGLITRALGLTTEIEPNVFSCDVQDGDAVLLCSDGVSNHLSDADLTHALTDRHSARSLVLGAQQKATAESLDDASAIVLDIRRTGTLRAMTERPLTIPSALHKGDSVDGWQLLRAFHGTDRVWLAEKEGQRALLKFAPAEARESEAHLDAFIRGTWNATQVKSGHFVETFEPADRTARCTGFFILLALTIWLALKLLGRL